MSLMLNSLMQIMGITGEIAIEASKYLKPLFYAAPVIALNYTFNGILFGLGYIKLYTIMALFPIVLSITIVTPITILWLNMGTFGAALAQIISYSIPVVI